MWWLDQMRPKMIGQVPLLPARAPRWTRRQVLGGLAGATGLLVGTRLLSGCGLDERALGVEPDATGTDAPPDAPDADAVQDGQPGSMCRDDRALPIPGTIGVWHVQDIDPTFGDPSTVYHFAGLFGGAIVTGEGLLYEPGSREGKRIVFGSDMRFQKGSYRGVDGCVRDATFGFV